MLKFNWKLIESFFHLVIYGLLVRPFFLADNVIINLRRCLLVLMNSFFTERRVPNHRKALILGYTGKLASRYIAQHCPTDLKWAVGGRSHQKLNAVIDDIKPINVNRQPPGIIIANADDSEALTELVQSTQVVVSVAGPFSKCGLVCLLL